MDVEAAKRYLLSKPVMALDFPFGKEVLYQLH